MTHDLRRYLLTLLALSASTASLRAADETSALALFDQRILPIMKSEKPSSCSECHLSGVDLRDYVRPSQKETFASLVAEGLIDVKNPDAELGADELAGQVEIQSNWPAGYGQMTIVKYPVEKK